MQKYYLASALVLMAAANPALASYDQNWPPTVYISAPELAPIRMAAVAPAPAQTSYASPEPTLASAPAYADLYNWNGFYMGLEGGGGGGNSRKDFPNAHQTTGDFDISGPLGGLTIGANYQPRPVVNEAFGALFAGIEGDISGTGINGSKNCPGGTTTCETENNWLATARARMGYEIGNFVPYITGGFAAGDVNVRSTGTGAVNFDETKIGWTGGGGMEMAFCQHWSVKAEYLYVKLQDTHGPSNTGTPTTTRFDQNIGRLGLNYRFN